MDGASLSDRASRHAALGDATRLAIVDELAVSDLAPSEICRRLTIESNLAAHHLAVLERVGLVERVPSEGDRRRRYVRLTSLGLVHSEASRIAADSVVFVCTGNSARSQLAAALWNSVQQVAATSVGTHPDARVHPMAVAAGEVAGVSLRGATPRPLNELSFEPDLVVTVCDRAHEELGGVAWRQLHWSIPDPVRAGRRRAFDATVEQLRRRIGVLAPAVQPVGHGEGPASPVGPSRRRRTHA